MDINISWVLQNVCSELKTEQNIIEKLTEYKL